MVLAKVALSLLMRAHQAQAIRPDDAHSAAARLGQDLVLQRRATLADFAESGRNDDRGRHVRSGTFADHAGNGGGRRRDHGQVHWLGNARNVPITRQPKQRVMLRVHRIDGAGKRSVLQIR